LPKIIVDAVDATTVSYTLQYLPRGMAHTLGNALRRLMLGYDTAASVTGMTIRGVTHEYQVLEGVKESVIDIMLNMKKLRFLLDAEDEKIATISQTFNGIGIYTSSNLKLPA
jgi:DNA-directed RNA polymerase subunit alpha